MSATKTPGQVAYEAYAKAAHVDLMLPEWSDVPPDYIKAYEAMAAAVIAHAIAEGVVTPHDGGPQV